MANRALDGLIGVPRRPIRSLYRSASLVTGLALLRGGFAFAAVVAITRALGPEGRGKFAFVITTAGVLAWIVSWGTGPVLTRAKATSRQAGAELYSVAWGVSVVTGTVMVGVWLLGFFVFRHSLFSGVTTGDAYWVGFLIPALIATNNIGHVASLEGKVVAFNGLLTLAAFAFALGLVVLTTTDSLTTSSSIGGWSAAAAMPLLLFRPGRSGVSRSRADTVLRFIVSSFRSSLASLAMFGMWRVDVFFVKAQRGYRELGFYAVAISIAEILLVIAASVRSALLVHQGGSENREALPELLARVTRLSTLAMTAIAIAAVATGDPLIGLVYGRDLHPAFPALLLLLPGVVALALHGPLFDYIYSEGRATGVIAVMGLALLLNLVLNVFLLRSHTFLASAAVSSLSYGLVLAACLVQFSRITGLPMTSVVVPRIDDLRPQRRRRHRG